WTYARQGKDSLAIGTEERLLARYGAGSDDAIVSAALLDIAHARFNEKRYKEGAGGYQDCSSRCPTHHSRLLALCDAGYGLPQLQTPHHAHHASVTARAPRQDRVSLCRRRRSAHAPSHTPPTPTSSGRASRPATSARTAPPRASPGSWSSSHPIPVPTRRSS